MTSTPRDLFNELSRDARAVVSEVADYYCLQVVDSNDPDLLTLLSQIRESFSCLTYVSELSAQVRQDLFYIAPLVLRSRSVPEPLDVGAVVSLVLPELAVCVASARFNGEAFDGDPYDVDECSSRNLPDFEYFRRGDLVHVRDRASDHFGRTGYFRAYSDPRIGHAARLAQVDFGRLTEEGKASPRETAELSASALQFAPELYANEREDTHLRTLARDGFEIRIFDSRNLSRQGKILLHYQLFDYRYEEGVEAIFEGSDFFVSPLHAPDDDATIASLLSFLSFQRGEIEAEYFEDYTPRQLAWRDERAGDLSMLALKLEESSRSDASD